MPFDRPSQPQKRCIHYLRVSQIQFPSHVSIVGFLVGSEFIGECKNKFRCVAKYPHSSAPLLQSYYSLIVDTHVFNESPVHGDPSIKLNMKVGLINQSSLVNMKSNKLVKTESKTAHPTVRPIKQVENKRIVIG